MCPDPQCTFSQHRSHLVLRVAHEPLCRLLDFWGFGFCGFCALCVCFASSRRVPSQAWRGSSSSVQELRSMLLSILSTLRALGWTMVSLPQMQRATVWIGRNVFKPNPQNAPQLWYPGQFQASLDDHLRGRGLFRSASQSPSCLHVVRCYCRVELDLILQSFLLKSFEHVWNLGTRVSHFGWGAGLGVAKA